jgi:hypothetical protein
LTEPQQGVAEQGQNGNNIILYVKRVFVFFVTLRSSKQWDRRGALGKPLMSRDAP